MSKSEEFSTGNDNTKEGKEARLAQLQKSKRERQLSVIFEKFFPLYREASRLEYYEPEEWQTFFKNFSEVIISLQALKLFEDDHVLKKECQEVLSLIDNKDIDQHRKYYDLTHKLSNFFYNNKVFMPPLPK